MNTPTRILGIAGSLRRASYNRSALRAAVQLAPEGSTIEIFELNGIPGFGEDQEKNPPEKVVELKRRIREADAILIVNAGIQLFDSGCFEEPLVRQASRRKAQRFSEPSIFLLRIFP